MAKKDVLQPVDDDARAQAGRLMRLAAHGSLAVLEPMTGHPLASRVSLATEVSGAPVFLISQLSAHFGALEADPRASLLVGEPGRGDPLAHARITVIGRAEKLADAARAAARDRFLRRHPKAALYADFADFAFWRLTPERASLNGGFGRAYALAASDLLAEEIPDLAAMEPDAVAHMNEDHADAVAAYATGLLQAEPGPWRLTGLDADGLDLALGDEIRRLDFPRRLTKSEEVRPLLITLARQARETSLPREGQK